MIGNFVCIPLHNPGWNANVFRVSAVVEQEVLAQILDAAPAEKADLARCGICRNDACSYRESGDFISSRDYIPSQFVAEYSGRNNHAGMIPALKYLHVGSARERNLDAHKNLSVPDLGNSHRLYLQVFLAIKNGGHHLAFHCEHSCG